MVGSRAHTKADTDAGRQRGAVTLRMLLLVFTGGLILLLLSTSLVLTLGSFRDYISGQLEDHARDGATALGMSLSHAIDGRDPVASSSLIDAAFDSSRYLSVQYLDHAGQPVAARSEPLGNFGVPDWFIALAEIPLVEGRAEVTQGWSLLGTVRVVSNPQQAYRDLWNITLAMVAINATVGGLGLVILFAILSRALGPLRQLEAQAQAVSGRDFSQRVTQSSTRDLNRVTRAMNQMSDDLGVLFEGQGKLIQHLRQLNNEDSVTGLASRTAFDQRLRVEVESEERAAPGALLLFQLSDFAEFNQQFGRDTADQMLGRVADLVKAFVLKHAGAFAGRRMGAEIAVYLPGAAQADARLWFNELVQQVYALYSDASLPLTVAVYGGIAQAEEGLGRGELLAMADEAMRQAHADGKTGCRGGDPGQAPHFGAESWRQRLEAALAEEALGLWQQPMVTRTGKGPAFYQVFSRIRCDDEWVRAGVFVPIAERFGLMPAVDRLVVIKAIDWLRQDRDRQLALSLGQSSLADSDFREQLIELLRDAVDVRRRLWIGVSEQAMGHHRKPVKALAQALGKLRVGMVIDHFGVGGVPFSYLQGLPIRALRIDHSFVHGIEAHEDNRFYLESVVSIAHSLGVQVYATGVETANEWETLQALGIDGAMGYHLGRPGPANGEAE